MADKKVSPLVTTQIDALARTAFDAGPHLRATRAPAAKHDTPNQAQARERLARDAEILVLEAAIKLVGVLFDYGSLNKPGRPKTRRPVRVSDTYFLHGSDEDEPDGSPRNDGAHVRTNTGGHGDVSEVLNDADHADVALSKIAEHLTAMMASGDIYPHFELHKDGKTSQSYEAEAARDALRAAADSLRTARTPLPPAPATPPSQT